MEWIFILLSIIILVFFLTNQSEKKGTKLDRPLPIIAKPESNKDTINQIDPALQIDINNFQRWKNEQTEGIIGSETTFHLFRVKPVLEIGYADMLNTVEWKFKRSQILIRDGYTCADCGIVSVHLHVHHKSYIRDEFPWEIEDEHLVSVCHACHKNIHDSQTIPVFHRDAWGHLHLSDSNFIYCYRCNGAGWFPQYRHVEAGVCFRCRGNCIEATLFSDAIRKFLERDQMSYENKLLASIDNYFTSLDMGVYTNNVKPIFFPSISSEDDLPC